MSKRNKKNKMQANPKALKRPGSFNSFHACVGWLKKSVYMVVRGRLTKINNKEIINWVTLGSGFVAAPNRFVTAAHVINNSDLPEHQHRDGDKYYLLRHDDEKKWHYRIFEPKIDNEIFLYPDIDIAIIYLDSDFYQVGDTVYANENDFIPISKDFYPIGSEVGVLGYPLCKLEFNNMDFTKPKIGNVLMRVDAGVINCRYQTSKTNYIYEFTMPFNPGNSGGPIFDKKTGLLVSIVKGFKVI